MNSSLNMTGPALIPMDAIEVNIWRQPDLSGKFYVDNDTTIKLPLLGRISLKEKKIDSLRVELFDLYKNYLGETFLVINFYYRISILGEVRRPGIYYISCTDKIPNLIAQAEGMTERGNLKKIRILRVGRERKLNIQKIIRKGKFLSELDLQPGDLVIVPRRTGPSLQEFSVVISAMSLGLSIYLAFIK